ncbi:prephenate dehydrogenase dimerization domain-containing protein, partial [Hydrogenivirga sp. 128-5-R1-1]|uniref:prephenate dehydrogenase dimerization domain-containing protein n=1 Tax=Hydrogenivirga sp. 128-5-R1-1 TaxID=392423 RepID=UPI00015F1711
NSSKLPNYLERYFLENKSAVLHSIDEFSKSLEKLKKLIEEENEKELIKLLSESREKRLSLEE